MAVRNCMQCGAEFEARNSRYNLCSDSCRREARNENRRCGGTAKICYQCGNSFQAASVRIIHCSKSCAKLSIRQKQKTAYHKRKKIFEIKCIACELTFQTGKKRRLFCDACKNDGARQRALLFGRLRVKETYGPIFHTCAECNERFVPLKHNAKCCSRNCSRTRNNKITNIWLSNKLEKYPWYKKDVRRRYYLRHRNNILSAGRAYYENNPQALKMKRNKNRERMRLISGTPEYQSKQRMYARSKRVSARKKQAAIERMRIYAIFGRETETRTS